MADARSVQKKKVFSLSDFKKSNNIETVRDKVLEWIPLSPAFQKTTGLPGMPKGYVGLGRGFTNTGKSTELFEIAVACQKLGIIPIIYDTEKNLNHEHLTSMGFDFEDDNKYIIIDNEMLRDVWGKQAKDRKDFHQATIEDVADSINYFLDEQERGNIEAELCFLWDSIGSINCSKSVRAEEKDTTNNNMWNAGALEQSFKGIINDRIPSSRKETKKYTNTFFAVQKIWIDSVGMGQPVVKHKGGEAFAYASRMIFHYGGIQSHGAKKVSATKDGRDIAFGIETNLNVYKNQVTGYNLEGRIISTPHGFIEASKDAIAKYKTEHINYFRDKLNIEGDFDIKVSNEEIKDFDDIDDLESK